MDRLVGLYSLSEGMGENGAWLLMAEPVRLGRQSAMLLA
jgi:hypothetical protein